MIADYFHTDAWILQEEFFKRGPSPSQSTLINGLGVWNASGTVQGKYAELGRFKRGGRYRLRIINAGVHAKFVVSVDSHIMEIIQSDFIPIVSISSYQY